MSDSVLMAGPLADKLHTEIKSLAGRTPGAPTFLPHVTLLGGIRATEADVLARAQQLAARLKVGWPTPGGVPSKAEVMDATFVRSARQTQARGIAANCSPAPRLLRMSPLHLQPCRISFDQVSYGAIFHQCVYVLCGTDADIMQVGGCSPCTPPSGPASRLAQRSLPGRIPGAARCPASAHAPVPLLPNPPSQSRPASAACHRRSAVGPAGGRCRTRGVRPGSLWPLHAAPVAAVCRHRPAGEVGNVGKGRRALGMLGTPARAAAGCTAV